MKTSLIILLIRIFAIVALLWALVSTIYLMTSPAAMTATQAATNGQTLEVESISWYEFAGFYGTLLLLLWTGLFALGAWSAWVQRIALLAVIAILTLIFTWLTSLSIYMPASLALVVALVLSGIQKR